MKCPFCNAELDYQIHTGEYACINTENCKFSFMVLPKKWWQALIDGKKAQEALQVATDTIIGATECRGVELIDWCNSGLKRMVEITEPKEE